MGFFKRAVKHTFHPNRVKREKQQAAQAQRDAVNRQAAQQLEAARIHRDNNLAEITRDCNAAREKIELWHQTESSQANRNYNEKQNEITNIIKDLTQSQDQYTQEIEEGFNAYKAKLIANQQADEQRLEQCYQAVTKLANETQVRRHLHHEKYRNNIHHIVTEQFVFCKR